MFFFTKCTLLYAYVFCTDTSLIRYLAGYSWHENTYVQQSVETVNAGLLTTVRLYESF